MLKKLNTHDSMRAYFIHLL